MTVPHRIRTRCAALAVLAAACALPAAPGCSGPSILGEDPSTLFDLPATDVLRVQVVDHSGWGDSAFELEFRRDGERSVKGTRLIGRWSETSKTFVVSRRSVPAEGRVAAAELAALDDELGYYRSDPDESCDDTRFITLTRLRKGKTIDTERLVDRSCREGLRSTTTLAGVFARLDVPK